MPETEVASDSDRSKFEYSAAGRDSVVGFENLLQCVIGPTLGAPAFARSSRMETVVFSFGIEECIAVNDWKISFEQPGIKVF